MTTIPAFYGVPHCAVAPMEVTVTRKGNRWLMAFVEDDELQPCAPMDSGIDEDLPVMSYVSDYFARIAVWAYARKWIAQGLTVNYRSDLECNS